MTTAATERASEGYLLGKDEGEAHWLLGMLEVVKIGAAETGGAFGLLEVTVRAGEGSPWHVHPDEDEWFYVLEGELTLEIEGKTIAAQPAARPSRPSVRLTPLDAPASTRKMRSG